MEYCIILLSLFKLPKWYKLIVGMSDLVSPFVVLYEDDVDAFWCFEMLLRRMVICIYVKLYWHM